jgi:ribosomal protein S18 acetylase RimI-like enzyme/8-oxo-dGTP pyrophosphatase MutT (NUDIX family)
MDPRIAGAPPLAEFSEGQRVMVKEGLPGVIDDILEGPGNLTSYFITLDNGQGGGEWAEGEITPLSEPSTASRVDASVEHTAADDYPELGTILSDRLPPKITAKEASEGEVCPASFEQTWGPDEHDGKCYRCGASIKVTQYGEDGQIPGHYTDGRPWHPSKQANRLEEVAQAAQTYADNLPRCTGCGAAYHPDEIEGEFHDHWTAKEGGVSIPGTCTVCGKKIKIEKGALTHADDSNEHAVSPSDGAPLGVQATNDEARDWGLSEGREDMEGEGFIEPPYPEDVAQVAAKLALYLPPKPPDEQRSKTSPLTGKQKAGYDEGFSQGQEGITRNPSDPLDEDFMIGFEIGWAEGVLVFREPANSWDMEDLGRDQTADVPPATVPTQAPYMLSSKQAAVVSRPWDGEQEEGAFPSPRHKTGLVYVIQNADPDQPGTHVWVLLSGTSMHQIAVGFADSVEQAREDAKGAAARGGKQATLDDDWGLSAEAGGFADFVMGRPPPEGPGHAYSYDWCRFRRDSHCWLPKELNEAASKQAGYAVWVPHDRGHCSRIKWEAQQRCPTGQPGPHSGQGGFTDATVSWEAGGQRNGVPDNFRSASLQTHAAFEMTATWKDIQAKAKRIRSEGGVRLVSVADNVVVAHVKGDNGVYETELVRYPGKKNAAAWHCGCKWSSYSWGRSGPWKRYEGRMCSHALAVQYEAQSRGAHGREMTLDEKQPAWMDAKHVHRPGDFSKDKQRYSSIETLGAGNLNLELVVNGDPMSARKMVWEARSFGGPLSEKHGTLAGYLVYDGSGDKARIKALEVNPGYQRQGVATWLLDKFLRSWPIEDVDPGEFTPAGAALWKKVTGEDVRPSTSMTLPNTRDWKYAHKVASRHPVHEQDPADLPPIAVLAHSMLSEGVPYREVRSMLLEHGIERPAEITRLARSTTFRARVKGLIRDLFLDDDGVKEPDGHHLEPDEVIYPGWHPTKGLNPNDTGKVWASKTAATSWQKSPLGNSYRTSIVGKNGQTYYITMKYFDHIEAFIEKPSNVGSGKQMVGGMSVWAEGDHHEVFELFVKEEHRRQGIASAMFDLAKEGYPDLTHAGHGRLSGDGEAFAKGHPASLRTASTEPVVNLVQRGDLHGWHCPKCGDTEPSGKGYRDPEAAREGAEVHGMWCYDLDWGDKVITKQADVLNPGAEVIWGRSPGDLLSDQSLVEELDYVGDLLADNGHPLGPEIEMDPEKFREQRRQKQLEQLLGAKDTTVPPSEHGDPRMQDAGVSVKKTKDGKYYVHTHRARGKSRDSVSSIPDSEIEYIRSTGVVTKQAMPVGPMPEGLRWIHRAMRGYPGVPQQHLLKAQLAEGHDLTEVGHIRWLTKDYKRPPGKKGEITYVFVHPRFQRRGIATELLRKARLIDPDVHHSDVLTDDGTAWSQVAASLDEERLLQRLWSGASMPENPEDRCTACSGTGEQRNGHECYICDATGTRSAELEGRAAGTTNANPENGLPIGQDDSIGEPGVKEPLVLRTIWDHPKLDMDAEFSLQSGEFGEDLSYTWEAPKFWPSHSSKQADRYEGEWLINGKPYSDGVWIEVQPDVWYRGTAYPDIPARHVVRRDGDRWAWEAQVLTFIKAPHEGKSPKGVAKTLEAAQEKALASLTKDHEFFRRYDERQRANLAQTEMQTAAVYYTEDDLRAAWEASPEAQAGMTAEQALAQVYHEQEPDLFPAVTAAKEYVQVGNEEFAREVTETKGEVAVNGQPYGNLRRDPQRPTSREWVLTDSSGEETEHPTKGNALFHAGRNHKASAKKDDAPTVSGVALKAADTGRILMLQRGLEDEKDPARGKWEFPGGHHEDGDLTSLHAGIREWEEEVGVSFPMGAVVKGTWTSPDGVYQGHVLVIPKERDLILTEGRDVDNPDDPDGDASEQVAWWDPDDACKNPALREECKKTEWKLLKSAHKEGTKMDIADEFGSLFDEAASDISATASQQRQVLAHWGINSDLHEEPEPALPVTYSEDEAEAEKTAARLRAALSGAPTPVAASTPTPNSNPGSVGVPHQPRPAVPVQHQAEQAKCPKCGQPFKDGESLELQGGSTLQHKGACPQTQTQSSLSTLPGETEEERGRRLLAYVDASLSGQEIPGPNPYAHLMAGQADNEVAAAAANYLVTKGSAGGIQPASQPAPVPQPIQTQALKTYSGPERQAIIDEGEEVTASNLDRLDISGTHYEALEATSSRDLIRQVAGGRDVPEDEDMMFLDGDPNLPDPV